MRRRGRNSMAAAANTADLFAGLAPPPALKVTPTPVLPCASTTAPAQHLPRISSSFARVRVQPLWYAAVFPDLPEPQAAAMLQRLSLSAQRFTSLVSIEMPNALLLEIKGSVRLFGSFERLHAGIDAAWNRLKLRACWAAAPTPLAALWLARAGKPARVEECGALAAALAPLPITCTAWDPSRLQTLRSMGVNQLRDLLRLPRAGVARRLGPDTVRDLDIALAKQAAPRRAFVPRERFRQRCDFETEIDTIVHLQSAIEPLIERCSQFLRERQAGVQAMELRLQHRVLPPTRVRLGLASITSERRRLAGVLDEKLNRLELPAPVKGMELLSGALQPLPANSLDAFAGLKGGARDTAPQLVERLRARLGEAAVYGVVSVAEHRPEAAWQRVHELRPAPAVPARHPRVADDAMPRPVWLLTEPVMLPPCDLPQLNPGGLSLEEGPERIESGWWDGKGVARDYYVARHRQGARWWIFQERTTRCWYLHGVFA